MNNEFTYIYSEAQKFWSIYNFKGIETLLDLDVILERTNKEEDSWGL